MNQGIVTSFGPPRRLSAPHRGGPRVIRGRRNKDGRDETECPRGSGRRDTAGPVVWTVSLSVRCVVRGRSPEASGRVPVYGSGPTERDVWAVTTFDFRFSN